MARCLEAVRDRLLEERRDPAQIYTLQTGETLQHIPISDILFFETAPIAHHILLHTRESRTSGKVSAPGGAGSGRVIDFLGNLNEIQSQLGEGFLRVHRAYLVALDKIEEVDLRHGRLRVGGYECLLSRRGKSELMRRLQP